MTTPARYAFDKARATEALTLIEDADETGDWDRVNKILTPTLCNIAEGIGLANFEPADDFEHNSQVNNLLSLAWAAKWVTGPFEPIYEHTEHTEDVQFRTDVGEHPATLRLVTPWQEIGDLIGYDDGGLVNNVGAEAAVEFLEGMVDGLNAVLTELDNYVAAQVSDAYERLLNAVTTDFEDRVLSELRVKAGLLWKCKAPTGMVWLCGWTMPEDAETCEGCGAARPTKQDGAAA